MRYNLTCRKVWGSEIPPPQPLYFVKEHFLTSPTFNLPPSSPWLDYPPLFGKWARAPLPNSLFSGRTEKVRETDRVVISYPDLPRPRETRFSVRQSEIWVWDKQGRCLCLNVRRHKRMRSRLSVFQDLLVFCLHCTWSNKRKSHS